MNKLTDSDFSWHADQPDVPGKTAAEMKAFLDAPAKTLMEKVNDIIDQKQDVLTAGDNVTLADGKISVTQPVDDAYNENSSLPQSGKAVAEAVTPLILQEMSATKPPLDNVLPLLAAIEKHKPIVICGEDGAKYFADAAYTDDTYIYVEYSALSATGEIEKRRARYGRDGVAAERLYAYKPQKLTVDQNYHWASTNPQSGTAVAEAVAPKQKRLTAGANITIVDDVISATGGGSAGVSISGEQSGEIVSVTELSDKTPKHVNLTLSLQTQSDGGEVNTDWNGYYSSFVNEWTYDQTSSAKYINLDIVSDHRGGYRVLVTGYEDTSGAYEEVENWLAVKSFFVSLDKLQSMSFTCSDVNSGQPINLNLSYSGYYEL